MFKTNVLGFRVPIAVSEVRFAIEEGANLIEIVNENPDGICRIRSKGIEGEAVIGIYNLRSGLQVSRVLIKILPRDLALSGF